MARIDTASGSYDPHQLIGPKTWTRWQCKNGCSNTWPLDTEVMRCPDCKAPLIRWIRYQEKTS